MLDTFSRDLALGIGIILVGFAVIALVARLRWKKLKPKLFPDKTLEATGKADAFNDIRSIDILRMAHAWLEAQPSPLARRALSTVAEIEGSPPLLEALGGLFNKALETDDVASLLINADANYSYLLVFPDRYGAARGVGRYRGFADGWSAHLAALRGRIGTGAASPQIVALLFFLDPNRGESALLLSFVDKDSMTVPAVLAGAQDRTAATSEGSDLLMEFKLAA